MKIHNSDTAVVFIDPQNEVLSETGKAWPLLHESLKENNTIENMERIFKAAKSHDFEVFACGDQKQTTAYFNCASVESAK